MKTKLVWALCVLICICNVSCEKGGDAGKSSSKNYESAIVGWWEWDMRADSGIRFMSNGSACFWDKDGTYDSFGWWIEGNVLCTREWAPGDSGTPSDALCSWAGNPNCGCFKEGGRHVTKILKLTDEEMTVSTDDDKAYDSDYDMPSQIKFKRLK